MEVANALRRVREKIDRLNSEKDEVRALAELIEKTNDKSAN